MHHEDLQNLIFFRLLIFYKCTYAALSLNDTSFSLKERGIQYAFQQMVVNMVDVVEVVLLKFPMLPLMSMMCAHY